MHHGAGENVGVPQKGGGFLHVSCFQQGADVGGGYPGSVDALLRHYRPGKSPALAVVRQQTAVSGTLTAEAEIITADEARRVVIPAQEAQKIRPVGIVHLFVKGQRHHPIHGLTEQTLPICGGVDQHRGAAEHQLVRMGAEGNDSCVAAGFPGDAAAFF